MARLDAQLVLDAMAKPPGSLGMLETWAARLCALQGTLQPSIQDAALIVFAGDHGIARNVPAVSAYPCQLTAAVFEAVAAGQAASSVLTRANGAHLLLVDVGIDGDVSHVTSPAGPLAPAAAASLAGTPTDPGVRHIWVHHAKVVPGTRSFADGPAMTPAELQRALDAGAAAVQAVCDRVCAAPNASRVALCLGELGIGNTTAAAALVAALTGEPPEQVCGRGTGVDDAGLAAKRRVVAAALAANQALIATSPLGALQALGGLEIAAMAGACLEAARRSMPVLVDGYISSAAALVAARSDPHVAHCLFLSHSSAEAGARVVAEALGQCPALDMGLRLGEGTGAVLALPLLRAAAAVMCGVAPLAHVLEVQSQQRRKREEAACAPQPGEDAEAASTAAKDS